MLCVLLRWDAPRQQLVARLRERGVPLRVWIVDMGDAPLDPGPMRGDAHNFRVVHPARLAEQLGTP